MLAGDRDATKTPPEPFGVHTGQAADDDQPGALAKPPCGQGEDALAALFAVDNHPAGRDEHQIGVLDAIHDPPVVRLEIPE